VRGSMNEERGSLTAEGAAVMRALHQTLDAEPKILDDPVALRWSIHRARFYKSRVDY
jgi:O-methyltransferase involved in polyketide biosynthesis